MGVKKKLYLHEWPRESSYAVSQKPDRREMVLPKCGKETGSHVGEFWRWFLGRKYDNIINKKKVKMAKGGGGRACRFTREQRGNKTTNGVPKNVQEGHGQKDSRKKKMRKLYEEADQY